MKSALYMAALVALLPGLACGGSEASRPPSDLSASEAAVHQRRLREFREVTTGQAHTCAISVEGKVACWGGNAVGQLGDGTDVPRTTPVWVQSIDNAIDVDAGALQTCALLEGGAARCWGSGAAGIARSRPEALEGVYGVIRSIAVGRTICAIDLPGRVYCWPGMGAEAPVGSGTPVVLSTAAPASYLDVGLDRVCTLSGPDEAECYRFAPAAEGGQLEFEPITPGPRVDDVRQLAVSGQQACVTGHGRAFCWGENEHGQLGTGDTEAQDQPTRIVEGFEVTHVTTGWHHSCATMAQGGVKCWGDNSSGQLGNGTTQSSLTPVDVVGLPGGVVRVAAGKAHTCVVTIGREVYCWGANEEGQLGDGTRESRMTPVRVDLSAL